jgi:hypothetical protein
MVAPSMLQNSSVKTWLAGVEPAWTLLDQASFAALHEPPSPMAGPIRLAADLTQDEIRQSAVARNALILLRAAAIGLGLKMTAAGNLSRVVVAEMRHHFTWPDYDQVGAFQFHEVINEPDFLPLYFVRNVLEAASLLRKQKGHLKISPAGRRMMEEPNSSALQALLFHVSMWHLDLGYLSRGLLHGWSQHDAGIVLWSLSVAATDWEPRERLSRLCTIPITCWTTSHGIRLPLQWRHRSFDHFCGLGSSNMGWRTPTVIILEDDISIAKPVCSIASCLLR